MLIESNIICGQPEEEAFVADALEVVKLKFVDSVESIDNTSCGYRPEFAHQHFGENEKIIGYKDLAVSVFYSDVTLFLTSSHSYSKRVEITPTLKPDDIEYKIKDALPVTQLDAYLPMAKFKQKLAEQKKFKPFGQLITKFSVEIGGEGQKEFGLYKFEKREDDPEQEEGAKYLERAQSLAFWYIDAVSYTDHEDPRYFNYFLFEIVRSPEEGHSAYKFAGYANLYRFYHYPDQDRVRIAQIMVAPSYRAIGLGARFLQAIYNDLWQIDSIYDITAESPADAFLYMRDFVDCANCASQPEFAPEKLADGFSVQMVDTARKLYKLNKAQARRVYEILRLHHTNWNVPAEKEAYKADVIKRLRKAVMDPEKDGGRLSRAMQGEQQSMAAAMHALDPDHQKQELEVLFENALNSYKHVLSRLVRYDKNFI